MGMKRNLAVVLILSFVLPVVLFACSGEKTESDYVNELRDRRYRDAAMMYVQEHKVKEAVPALLELIKKRYSTLKAVYTLGIIGDPVAVPPLLEELREVAKKDSLDHDRMTEQISMTLGMIGATNSVDTLIWTAENAGEMGRAGAVQALGMIGDKRATQSLINVVKNENEKLLIRHYAAIALGRIADPIAAETLVYALYVDDETGRNLFRDGQLSLIQIGGEAARNALIAGYEGKNTDANALAEKIKLKTEWVQIKIVNVMGELRDPAMEDFLMARFEEGVKNDLVYEIFAKVVQALERTPLSEKALDRLAEVFLTAPQATEFLNERELISKVLIANNATKNLDAIMKVAEKGDISLKNPRGQMQKYSQWCVAAANIVSTLADSTYSDRFAAFAASGKCNAEIWGLGIPTKEILANMNDRMTTAKSCTDNAQCWVGQLKSPEWAAREKAIYYLANTGDKKFMQDIYQVAYTPKEEVRAAVQYAVWKLANPEMMTKLLRFWQDQKINKDFQKITEDIGYILYIKMREFKMDEPRARDKLLEEAVKMDKSAIPVPPPLKVSAAEEAAEKAKAEKEAKENAAEKEFDETK
jgi:HEAT repeat protein